MFVIPQTLRIRAKRRLQRPSSEVRLVVVVPVVVLLCAAPAAAPPGGPPTGHESRERLYETVDDAPGVRLSELCDRAGVTLSTARHHLRVLEDEGLIATAKHRGKRRYFLADDDGRELAAAMADDAAATVLETLAYTGPATVSTLAGELGRDPSTVTHHLKRLDEDGLVARERDGRAVMNSLDPAVESVLAPTVADAPPVRRGARTDGGRRF